MGQEIARHYFTENDFKEFHVRLKNETRLLDEMLRDKGFSGDHGVGGFELEAWIIDDNCMPLAINEEFMAHVGDPLLESELACFNIEINTHPYRLEGNVLSKFHRELEKIWSSCLLSARDFDAKLILTGILPTVTNSDLKPENMSKRKRYRALNDQIMLQRQGNPICIDIKAKDHLKLNHFDVMLEAATTAFQLQFQVDIAHSVRFINAAMILSAPVVAVTANSPFLFGLDLWDETRIPLFEQSVTLRTEELDSVDMSKRRVTFGSGYVKDSVVECFTENRERYEVLLPMIFDGKTEDFSHLRLHNGTVWRWNRPLIGFNGSNEAHLRIEHRVMPAGPSLVDTTANAAFFFGLIQGLASLDGPLEEEIPFEACRDNFYKACKDSLNSSITWTRGKDVPVRDLLLEELIPLAQSGLEQLDIDRADSDYYLGVIRDRVITGQTGCAWQRKYQSKRKSNMQELCFAYLERQEQEKPVHEWSL